MGWVSRCNPALVDAVVASFTEPDEAVRVRLSSFRDPEWVRTEYWLDTSGLALYFLDEMEARGLSHLILPKVYERLKHKLAQNKARLAEMMREFACLNEAFQQAGVCYANLKGYTFFPSSCPDLSLRHQSDFDFLVDPVDLDTCRTLLEEQGYQLTGSSQRSWEFRSSGLLRTSLDGQYDARYRRSVELHIGMEGRSSTDAAGVRDPRLNRIVSWPYQPGGVPSLDAADQLIGQALHLLGHFRHEHTRVSWLLEYRRHVQARSADGAFWDEVASRAGGDVLTATAFGLSTLLASMLFGAFAPRALDAWTVDVVPWKVKMWAEVFGRKALLADVPGTKLYLFLEDALREVLPPGSSPKTLRRLVPLRRTDRMLVKSTGLSLAQRLWGELTELRFAVFRVRFHVRQGIRYLVAFWRWRRICAAWEHARFSPFYDYDPHAES